MLDGIKEKYNVEVEVVDIEDVTITKGSCSIITGFAGCEGFEYRFVYRAEEGLAESVDIIPEDSDTSDEDYENIIREAVEFAVKKICNKKDLKIDNYDVEVNS